MLIICLFLSFVISFFLSSFLIVLVSSLELGRGIKPYLAFDLYGFVLIFIFFKCFSDVEHGAATTSESKSIKRMRFAIS